MHVDTLPACDASKVIDSEIDPSCEVKANVIDAKKDLLKLREKKAAIEMEQRKRDEELALREAIKKERYLKQHPELAAKM